MHLLGAFHVFSAQFTYLMLMSKRVVKRLFVAVYHVVVMSLNWQLV